MRRNPKPDNPAGFPAPVGTLSWLTCEETRRPIGRRLKPVLTARGVEGRGFLAYFAFAQKLGRFSRDYSGHSVAKAAGDLYEVKGLDRDTLIAIAAVLFGVTDITP